jgi:hypothetical protein
MDDDFWDNPEIQRKMLEELRDPEKLRAINELLELMLDDFRRWRAADRRKEVERARRIDSFWKPQPSPYWPERLVYERRKIGRKP